MGPMASDEGHTTMCVRAELRYRLPTAEVHAEIKRREGERRGPYRNRGSPDICGFGGGEGDFPA